MIHLSIENISFSYPKNPLPILSNFSYKAPLGSITAILGPSGVGKSTLLRIISGLETKAHGTISLENQILQNATAFIPPEKRRIGYLFQDYALFPFMTVRENIAFGAKGLDKRNRKEIKTSTDDLLTLTQLSNLCHRYPHELSGGQQQRVALARTLAAKPKLLLMDEPFSSLDSSLVEELRMDLKKIIKSQGLTTLFVTHNQHDAETMADHIIYF